MKCNLEYYFTAGDVEDDSRTRKSTGDAQGKAQRKRLESDQTETFYFERDAAKKFNLLTALSEEQPVKVRRNGKGNCLFVAKLQE